MVNYLSIQVIYHIHIGLKHLTESLFLSYNYILIVVQVFCWLKMLQPKKFMFFCFVFASFLDKQYLKVNN